MKNKEFEDFIDSISSFDTKIFDGELHEGVDSISATLDEDQMEIYIEFDEHTRTDTEVDMEDLDLYKSKKEILRDVFKFLDIDGLKDKCELEYTLYNDIEVKTNLDE